eukprot:SAG31_NODE_4303_length_3370_cov_1.742281_2_plen_96_part_00
MQLLAVDEAVLVTSDLRGNDSHGVSNMLRNYIEGFLRGRPDRGYKIGGRIYAVDEASCADFHWRNGGTRGRAVDDFLSAPAASDQPNAQAGRSGP